MQFAQEMRISALAAAAKGAELGNLDHATAWFMLRDVVIIGPYRTLDQLKDGTVVELDQSDDGENASSDESARFGIRVKTGGGA